MKKRRVVLLILYLSIMSLWGQPASPVRFIAEWEPALGTLIRWPLGIPGTLVTELAMEDQLYMLVASQAEAQNAQSVFDGLGVNPTHVHFIQADTFSHWTRDWGPHQVFDGNGEWGIVDPMFDGYPWVPGGRDWSQDDAVNATLGEYFDCPVHAFPAFLTGGNIMTDGAGSAFSTQQMLDESAPMWTPDQFEDLALDWLGIERYHFFSNPETYGIQHIDCWAKLLDEETVLVRELSPDHPEYAGAMTILEHFSTLTTIHGRPYRIVRIACPEFEPGHAAAYTNSLILNDRVLVPTFGIPADSVALETYRQAMPGYRVRGFYSADWYTYDALHCRTMGIFDREMVRISHRRLDSESQQQPLLNATVRAMDGSGIQNAPIVYWRAAGDGQWNELTLSASEEPWQYHAVLPAVPAGTDIQYYLWAESVSGKRSFLPPSAPAGFYETTIFGNVSASEEDAGDLAFHIAPNPASDRVSIELSQDIRGVVKSVEIYNIRGQKVRTILAGNSEIRSVVWDCRDHAGNPVKSGIYMIRLRSGNRSGLRKCVVFRQ